MGEQENGCTCGKGDDCCKNTGDHSQCCGHPVDHGDGGGVLSEEMKDGVCEDPIDLICGPKPNFLLAAPENPTESILSMIMAGKEVELAVDFFTKPEEVGAAYTERVRGEIRIIENSAGERLVLIYCEDVMPVGILFEHVERGLFNIEVEFRKLAQSYLNQKYGMLPLKKDVPD